MAAIARSRRPLHEDEEGLFLTDGNCGPQYLLLSATHADMICSACLNLLKPA